MSSYDPGVQVYDSQLLPEGNVLQVFNVHQYGAKGDGVTDDSVAFQHAANAAGFAGGGIMWIPATPQHYAGTTTITVPASVTVWVANGTVTYPPLSGGAATVVVSMAAYVSVNEAPLSPLDPRIGAKFDGVTDDTAALQTFYDSVYGVPAGYGPAEGRMPNGTAKLTGTLLVRPTNQYSSAKITGAGRPLAFMATSSSNVVPRGEFTYLRQDGGDIPIISFAVNGAQTTMTDFGVGWASQPTSANTGRIAIKWDGSTAGNGATWFEQIFARLAIFNPYKAFALVTTGGQSATVWGNKFDDIAMTNVQHNAFALNSSVVVGQPINAFRGIRVNNANGLVVADGVCFDQAGAVEAHMSGIDIEGWVNQILACGGGYSTDIEGLHVEHHVVDGTTTSGYALLVVGGGFLKVRNASFAGTSLGGAFGITALANAQNAGDVVDLDGITTAFSSVTGALDAVFGGSGSYKLGDIKATSGVVISVPSTDTATNLKTTRSGSLPPATINAGAGGNATFTWTAGFMGGKRISVAVPTPIRYLLWDVITASGNVDVGIIQLSGANRLGYTRIAHTGVVACPVAGVVRADLGAQILPAGDYGVMVWSDSSSMQILGAGSRTDLTATRQSLLQTGIASGGIPASGTLSQFWSSDFALALEADV